MLIGFHTFSHYELSVLNACLMNVDNFQEGEYRQTASYWQLQHKKISVSPSKAVQVQLESPELFGKRRLGAVAGSQEMCTVYSMSKQLLTQSKASQVIPESLVFSHSLLAPSIDCDAHKLGYR